MTEDKQTKNFVEPIKSVFTKKKVANLTSSLFIQAFLIVVLLAAGVVSFIVTRSANNSIELRTAEAKETTRPANLEIVVVTDKSCEDCSLVTGYIDYLKTQNVKIKKEGNLDILDSQAQELVEKYNIKKIPFFVVTGEINKNDELKELWTSWGGTQDSAFVLTNVFPPYLNLVSNKVDGRVSVTYLTDNSCEECYDVIRHKTVLESSFGLKIVSEKTIDIADSEGKELLSQYNITKVPTFLADNEAAVYGGLLNVWNSVGSIESDGTYIFREVGQMGSYYDLDKQELVKPVAQVNTNQGSQ